MRSTIHLRSTIAIGLVLCATAAAGAACSAAPDELTFDEGSGGADGEGSSGTGNGEGGLFVPGGTPDGGVLQHEPKCEGVDPNIDNDHDGWSGAQGDCNDCTAQMNPGAQDFAGNGIDEDCNGAKDDNPTACDAALAIDSNDAMDGARALGLCKIAQGQSWGVISAEYVTADGLPLAGAEMAKGHGILDGFGPNVNPQEGAKMLVLSSGAARRPTDPGYESPGGYWKSQTPSGAPPGYPKESPSCPGVTTGAPYDSAGLRVVIRTPTNAKSLKFNLNFYTYEFPIYICSQFNDFFVAMLSPIPQGMPDGNISFDAQGNTISVNAGFLEVCQPQMAGGKNFACALGYDQLIGTGFDEQSDPFSGTLGSAATGWLVTTAPVENPGAEITLMFAIWDSGDGVLDSTVLLDNFTFDVDGAATETEHVDVPK